MKKIIISGIAIIATTVIYWSCSKEKVDPMPASLKAWSLWQNCGAAPSVGWCPVAEPSGCCKNFKGVQSTHTRTVSGFSCSASLIGGPGAGSSADEIAVFITNNISSWNGLEMGLVKTLNDGSLKAYIQGGGRYLYAVIGNTNGGSINCSVSSSNHSQVNINGKVLTNSGQNYYNQPYHFVATTHRNSCGWGSTSWGARFSTGGW